MRVCQNQLESPLSSEGKAQSAMAFLDVSEDNFWNSTRKGGTFRHVRGRV